MKRSDELKQQYENIRSQCEAIDRKADLENRALSPAESIEFQNGMTSLTALQADIDAALAEERAIAARRAAHSATRPMPTPVYNLDSTPYTGGAVNIVTPTLSAFKAANKSEAARDAYDVGLWIKANIGGDGAARQKLEARRGTSWLASQNESSAVNGGYLVPAPLSNAVIISRESAGALRKLARIVRMTSETLSIPKQSDGTNVYYPGEEGSITPSDLDFGRVSLQAKKRAIYSLISSELDGDALVSVADLLAQDMGHQFALQEDKEAILGDGTGAYGNVGGIKQAIAAATASVASAATGHDTWAELDFTDFAAVMAKLPAKYRAGNDLAWLCSPSFKWAVMDRLALGANGALSQVWVDGQPQDRFLGYPVVLSDYCETATAASSVACYFGNWRRAVLLGERSEVRIALSEHVAFQTDQIAVRGTVRYDIAVHEPGDTTNAGSICGLKTAS